MFIQKNFAFILSTKYKISKHILIHLQTAKVRVNFQYSATRNYVDVVQVRSNC